MRRLPPLRDAGGEEYPWRRLGRRMGETILWTLALVGVLVAVAAVWQAVD